MRSFQYYIHAKRHKIKHSYPRNLKGPAAKKKKLVDKAFNSNCNILQDGTNLNYLSALHTMRNSAILIKISIVGI